MTFDYIGDLNWWAVIVAAIVYWLVGAAWFQTWALGRPWMRSIGWDPDQEPPKMTAMSVVGPLIGFLIAAVAVGMLAAATGTDTFSEGLILGLVLGIGVSAVVFYVTAVFDPKKPGSMTWMAVESGYHLVGLLAASVLVAIWH